MLVLGSALLPRGARASEPLVAWSAPAECPSSEAFEALLVRSLGEPVEHFESRLRFRAEVVRVGGIYRLVVEDETGGAAPRTLEDARCEGLADAAAVVIALALRHAREAAAPAEPTTAARGGDTAAQSAKTAAAPTPSESGAETADRELHRRGQGSLSAHWLADSGTLPRLAPGARLGFGYRLGVAAGNLRVGFIGPRATETEPGGRFSLTFVQGDLCASPLARPAVTLDLCGAVEAGWLSGRGTGISEPHRRSSDWLALGGRLGAGYSLGTSGWRGELGLGLLGVANRSPFVLDGPAAVHEAAPVVGRLEIGLSRTFR